MVQGSRVERKASRIGLVSRMILVFSNLIGELMATFLMNRIKVLVSVTLALLLVASVAQATESRPAIQIDDGSLVVLVGLADLQETNELLAPHGLEAIPNSGFAVVGMAVQQYD